MKTLAPLLFHLVSPDPEYVSTRIFVDMSAMTRAGEDSNAIDLELQYGEIYPRIATILALAHVPIVEPESVRDRQLLDQLDIERVSPSGRDVVLHIGLTWKNWPDWAYVIHVEVERPEGEFAIPSFVCEEECPPEDIGPRVATEQDAILALLRIKPLPSSASRFSPKYVVTSSAPETGTVIAPRKLSGFGIAGIAVGTMGLGLMTFGIVQTALPDRTVDEPNNNEQDLQQRYRTPASEALLWTGLAGLVTGGVLIGVDRWYVKRHPQRRAAVVPLALPAMSGLLWTGTF